MIFYFVKGIALGKAQGGSVQGEKKINDLEEN